MTEKVFYPDQEDYQDLENWVVGPEVTWDPYPVYPYPSGPFWEVWTDNKVVISPSFDG